MNDCKIHIIDGVEYIRPVDIQKMMNVTRVTVWRYLKEMRAQEKYKHSFKTLSWTLRLVNKEHFNEFLDELHAFNERRGY